MRAVMVRRYGGPDVLEPAEVPDPRPGPPRSWSRSRRAGLTSSTSTTAPAPIPAVAVRARREAAGMVASSAEMCAVPVGDRVAWVFFPAGTPSWSRSRAPPVPLPDGRRLPVAASALLQGMTAHYLIDVIYRPEPGETVLVHAGREESA